MIRIKRRGKPPATERMVWYNIFTFKLSGSSRWKSLLQSVLSDTTIFYLQMNQTILIGRPLVKRMVHFENFFLQIILINWIGKPLAEPMVSMAKKIVLLYD